MHLLGLISFHLILINMQILSLWALVNFFLFKGYYPYNNSIGGMDKCGHIHQMEMAWA